MNPVLKGLFSAALVLAVALSFRTNFTGLGTPGSPEEFRHTFADFDSTDELMVKNRLTAARAQGVFSQGGFLLEGEGTPVPYKSRTGLQGQIFGFAYVHTRADLAGFVASAAFLMDLALATVLLLFCAAVQRHFGWIAAGTVLVLLLLSDWIVFFSGSLYWVTFSFFLPFVISFLWYPKLLKGGAGYRPFLIVTGLLVFFKALLGYEFATNVLLSATVPVLYFDILAGKRWQDIARMIGAVSLAGALGLAAAIMVHTVQSWIYHGSLRLALAHFLDRAAYRSLHSPQIHYGILVKLGRNIVRYSTIGICTIFRFDGKLRVSVPMYALNVGVALGFIFSLADARYIPALRTERRKLFALCAACGWGLLCSLTWFFVATDHTYSHLYMDPIMFYVPYGLLVYALLGTVLSLSLQRLGTLWKEIRLRAMEGRESRSGSIDVAYGTAASGRSGHRPGRVGAEPTV
jgi:hypothetical protein